MRHQALGFRHGFHRFANALQAGLREALEGDFFGKTVEVHSAIGFGKTAGGQRVVGAAGIIARTFRRIRTNEHRPRILHLLGKRFAVVTIQYQMLGRVFVHELHHFFVGAKHDDATVAQRLRHHFAPRQGGKHLRYHTGQTLGKRLVGGEQYRLAIRTMLGLRKKIARHKALIGTAISHHKHFARSGRHINRHAGTIHLHFRFHHKAIARTEYLAHPRHALGAKCHCCHGLCATTFKDGMHPTFPRRIQNGGMHFAIDTRRGAHHHIAAPRYACRHGEHQHGGK